MLDFATIPVFDTSINALHDHCSFRKLNFAIFYAQSFWPKLPRHLATAHILLLAVPSAKLIIVLAVNQSRAKPNNRQQRTVHRDHAYTAKRAVGGPPDEQGSKHVSDLRDCGVARAPDILRALVRVLQHETRSGGLPRGVEHQAPQKQHDGKPGGSYWNHRKGEKARARGDERDGQVARAAVALGSDPTVDDVSNSGDGPHQRC